MKISTTGSEQLPITKWTSTYAQIPENDKQRINCKIRKKNAHNHDNNIPTAVKTISLLSTVQYLG